MNQHYPTFSVIMACYNAERYIQKAIDSVLRQTYTNWELIIVDDASEDRSLDFIIASAKADPRIKYLSLAGNTGAAGARNAAIEIAKGEWLAILDADDIFLPEKLDVQLALISRASRPLVLVGSGCFHIDECDNRLRQYKYPASSRRLKSNLFRNKEFPPHSSMIYLRSEVKSLGGFNKKFPPSEDYDLWLRLSELGAFASSPKVLIEYRLHAAGISNFASTDGYRVIEYATAARVCQMLRKAGRADPGATQDNGLWQAFMTCVASVIRNSGYYDSAKWKQELKSDVRSQRTQILGLQRLVFLMLKAPKKSMKLFVEHVLGLRLAETCFQRWIFQASE